MMQRLRRVGPAGYLMVGYLVALGVAVLGFLAVSFFWVVDGRSHYSLVQERNRLVVDLGHLTVAGSRHNKHVQNLMRTAEVLRADNRALKRVIARLQADIAEGEVVMFVEPTPTEAP